MSDTGEVLHLKPGSILKTSSLQPSRTADFNVVQEVTRRHKFPFKLAAFQAEACEEFGWMDRAGFYAEVGTGKTVMSTVTALFQRQWHDSKIIVVGPPILCRQWARWLRQFTRLSVLIYAGSPAERKKLKPANYSVVVMSMQIFKSDCDRLMDDYDPYHATLIVDEATSVKNISSANHKAVRKFSLRGHRRLCDCDDRALYLLTGTPLTTPMDAYAYTKLLSGVYQTQDQFEQLHVGERDFFGKVVKYLSMDTLQAKFLLNAFRVLKEDANPQMPREVYTPLFYDLSDAHYKLYQRIATEQLLLLENGTKIDATTPNRLFHTLQQAILSPAEYVDNGNDMRCAVMDLLDETMEELGDGKLLISANYQRSIASLLGHCQQYGAVAVNGTISDAQQQKNIARFIEDKSCRVLILQPSSGGYGLDGLQHVCQDLFMAELPITPRDFHQVVGRLKRTGQEHSVHVRIAVAADTLQVRLQDRFLTSDELVNVVQLSYQDLRAAIYGE